jgi:hypothetical protein
MSTEIQQPTQRSDKRIAFTEDSDVHCVIEWEEDGNSVSVKGQISDISSKGLKFFSPTIIDTNAAIRLTIFSEELQVEVTANAVARWTEPRDDSYWITGCELLEDLPDELVARLAVTGCINRRQETRYPTNFVGHLSQELSGDSELDVGVRIEDYSTSGMRIFSPRPAQIGHRILLRLRRKGGKHVDATAKVMWQVRTAAGYFIGCMFLTRSGSQAVAGAARDTEAEPELGDERSKPSSTAWIWFVFGTIITLFILRLFGIIQN